MHDDPAVQQQLMWLQEERGRLSAMAAFCRDGLILLSNELHLLLINAIALSYLDLPGAPEDWVERSGWDLVRELRRYAPEAVDAVLKEVRRVSQGDDRASEGECEVGLRTIRWLNLVIDLQQRSLGRMIVLQDVTESRLLSALRKDLTHMMLHDLRDPIANIVASLDLIAPYASTQLAEDQQQHLQEAAEQANQLVTTINEFVDLCQLEGGRMPLSPDVFSFVELADAVVQSARVFAQQRDLRLGYSIDNDLPLTWGDQALIQRVLQSLITNALFSTPPGGQVEIEAALGPYNRDKIRVSVHDTGSRMPDEVREHLFDKFALKRYSRVESGLSLAFCRLVVEAHGERIWVSNTSEAGNAITFTLPRASETLLSVYSSS